MLSLQVIKRYKWWLIYNFSLLLNIVFQAFIFIFHSHSYIIQWLCFVLDVANLEIFKQLKSDFLPTCVDEFS